MNLRCGIDVGAKHEIYNVIMRWRRRVWRCCLPPATYLKSSALPTRIVVMREGEIAGELLHEQADERQALSLAMPKVSQAVA